MFEPVLDDVKLESSDGPDDFSAIILFDKQLSNPFVHQLFNPFIELFGF